MAGASPRGLVIVYTGDGKGKTTAALGLAMRAVGHGKRVAFVQFLKHRPAGEHQAAERLAPHLEMHPMGTGFVRGEPTPDQVAAARRALDFTRACLTGRAYHLVVADEVLTAAGLALLTHEEVESLLADRPAEGHLALTGRGAWSALTKQADLVTEMRLVKHPYDRGVEAQEGVEY